MQVSPLDQRTVWPDQTEVNALRLLYLDCSAGIAGDMLLAALLDLGASFSYVEEGLHALTLSERWEIQLVPTQRRGISAKQLIVTIDGRQTDQPGKDHLETDPKHRHHPWHSHPGRPHHQDLDYQTHGHGHRHHDQEHHQHDHGHRHDDHDPHQQDYGHRPHDHHDHDHHDHDHDHEHHHDGIPARPYREIRDLLHRSALPERVRLRAQAVFAELAQAEGAVHGISPDDVHFHEVGSTDAIIDVVGVALALESLGVDEIVASPLHLGTGFVKAAHGRLPVPAPATLRLVEGLSVYQTDIAGELVTPTGAALVRALCRGTGPMPRMRILRSGWGAGAKDFPIPNVLRAVLGEIDATTVTRGALDVGAGSAGGTGDPGGGQSLAGLTSGDAGDLVDIHDLEDIDDFDEIAPDWDAPPSGFETDEVIELAANVDDMTPQLLSAAVDALLDAGALDAWVTPVVMKKGRPGHVLHALAQENAVLQVAGRMLQESTSLGLRLARRKRLMLQRRWIQVSTSAGPVRVKVGQKGDEVWNVAPEYDDCLQAARRQGIPLKRVMAEAHKAALEILQAAAKTVPAKSKEAKDSEAGDAS